MNLKPAYSALKSFLWPAILLVIGYWLGWSIPKPMPTAEQQMMALQEYIGVEPDGAFGKDSRIAYDLKVEAEWKIWHENYLQQFYTESGGPK